MAYKRKTRKQKIESSKRRAESGFSVKKEWLETKKKSAHNSGENINTGTRFLKKDLTKTFVLTMLVLALELALWLYLSRR